MEHNEKGGVVMLHSFIALIMSFPFLMLRLTGSESAFPKPLSQAEEDEYVRRAVNGDISARNTLIEHNLRLVAHIIKKYYVSQSDQDDLISIGTIGLIKGISTYKPSKGVRLATYASRCIENEILMHFRSLKKSAGDVSLSDTLDSDPEGGTLSIIDVVSVEDDIVEALAGDEALRAMREGVDALLDEREKEIITLRYGLGGIKPITQREIADKLNISRSYVSRIEKRALGKLKEKLRSEELLS